MPAPYLYPYRVFVRPGRMRTRWAVGLVSGGRVSRYLRVAATLRQVERIIDAMEKKRLTT